MFIKDDITRYSLASVLYTSNGSILEISEINDLGNILMEIWLLVVRISSASDGK